MRICQTSQWRRAWRHFRDDVTHLHSQQAPHNVTSWPSSDVPLRDVIIHVLLWTWRQLCQLLCGYLLPTSSWQHHFKHGGALHTWIRINPPACCKITTTWKQSHSNFLSLKVQYARIATLKLTFYCFHGNVMISGQGGSLKNLCLKILFANSM